MSHPNPMDAVETARAVAAGELSAEQVVTRALNAARDLGGRLNLFLSLDRERALDRARAVDSARAAGRALGPLAGVPVALKANMCAEGFESNCASRILAGYHAPYTATFVMRLLDAGAIPIGVTNMDEFAMGSSGENSAFGPAKNPWDEARTPGGSSSGAAGAVAAGIVPIALGSDTGGSVRQPAALCGILGLKPTYGRISRYGLIAFASSLDQVSPFARSVRDLELLLELLSGADPLDSTSLPLAPLGRSGEEGARLDGLRIGVPAQYMPAGLDPRVRTAIEASLATFESLGAKLVEVSLPHTDAAIACYYVVATAEASSNLARFEGVRYGMRELGDGSLQGMMAATRAAGFGPEVKRRILLGTYVLSSGYYAAWYGQALKVRRLLRRDFDRAFEQCDVIAGPTSPTPAFRLGAKTADPVAMYLNDILTAPASLAGLPALSLPCGFAEESGTRLPLGLQLIAPPLEDARVLRAARAFESATDFHTQHPALFAS